MAKRLTSGLEVQSTCIKGSSESESRANHESEQACVSLEKHFEKNKKIEGKKDGRMLHFKVELLLLSSTEHHAQCGRAAPSVLLHMTLYRLIKSAFLYNL